MFHTRRLAAIGLVMVPVILVGCGKSPTADTQKADNTPPELDMLMTTSDAADTIAVTSTPLNLTGVRVCLLVTSSSGWWKGIGFNQTDPTIQGATADGQQCANINPGLVNLTFWKAKVFGVHAQVGTGSIDLTQYAGSVVLFSWRSD